MIKSIRVPSRYRPLQTRSRQPSPLARERTCLVQYDAEHASEAQPQPGCDSPSTSGTTDGDGDKGVASDPDVLGVEVTDKLITRATTSPKTVGDPNFHFYLLQSLLDLKTSTCLVGRVYRWGMGGKLLETGCSHRFHRRIQPLSLLLPRRPRLPF